MILEHGRQTDWRVESNRGGGHSKTVPKGTGRGNNEWGQTWYIHHDVLKDHLKTGQEAHIGRLPKKHHDRSEIGWGGKKGRL